MKTSKIIFITLLSIIALYIVAAMIDVRVTGLKWSEFNNNLKVEKKAISPFSVLYLSDIKNIKLAESVSPYIDVKLREDSTAPEINYTCIDDTLRIKDFQWSASSSIFVTVYVGKGLKTIKLENSDILITKFNSNKLSLVLNKSKVSFVINKLNNSAIGTMNIIAENNSSIAINSVDVDSIGIVLRNSVANLAISAKTLSGVLSDNSKIFTRQPGEISLKRDATSKITINSY